MIGTDIETLEETLVKASVTPGRRLFAVRLAGTTFEQVSLMAEKCGDATVLLVRPPYLIVEAEELDPTVGTPVDDLSALDSEEVDGEVDGGLEDGSDPQHAEASGQGYEISGEDWASVLLICNGQPDDVDDVAIDWLIEAGLAERSAGGTVKPTKLALTWTRQHKQQ